MSLLPLKAPRAILIARTDKIGDFVVSIPSYATAKAMYPQAKIIALVSRANRILAEHVAAIDECVCLDDFADASDDVDVAAAAAKLKSLQLDAFVALVSNNTISRLAVASGAAVRVGPRSKPLSFVHYNYGLRQKRSQCIKSEAAYNLELIAHLDPLRYAEVGGAQLQRLTYAPEDAAPADAFLREQGLMTGDVVTPFILINPFTGGSGANLSSELYAVLIAHLLRQGPEHGATLAPAKGAAPAALPAVVLMAVPSQQDKVEQLLAQLSEQQRAAVHVFINTGSLMVATALVDRCTFFIGPSTGITQIAGNLHKPAFCFYSSRLSNSHTRWALYGDKDEIPVTLPLEELDPVTKEIKFLPDEQMAKMVHQTLKWYEVAAQAWSEQVAEQVAAQEAVPLELPLQERPDATPAVPAVVASGKPSLTVAIIAHNEQDRLPKTLAAVADIASEIVLINSCSTDNTVEVARSFGAQVYTEEFKGYVEQKNSLIPKCTQDWILFLDADEVLNPELKAAIVAAIAAGEPKAYEMNRLTFYLGKLLKHAWQPNYRLRLVRRAANPKWVGEIVHEALECSDPVARLPGYIVHYSYRDVNDHFERTIRYAKMSAQSYIKRGKKPSLLKIIFSPIFSFIKLYFIKLGCLDGRAGYIAAQSAFIYTFLKYVFLWEASLGLKSQFDERAPKK